MDTKLKDYDICKNSGGKPFLISGFKELLQKIWICLTVKKGSFVYNKELGSELYKIKTGQELTLERCRMLINEALIGIPDVNAEALSVTENEDGSQYVSVRVEYKNQTEKMEVCLSGEL